MTINKTYSENKSGDLSWSSKIARVYAKGTATPEGRFSWPALAEPKPGMPQADGSTGAARYEVTLLIDKKDKEAEEFIREISNKSKSMLAMYNEKKAKSAAKLGEIDNVLKDGDDFDTEKYSSHKGMWVLVARSKNQPKIVNADRSDLDPLHIKGGMYGKLVVTPHLGASGLSYQCEVVQFLKDDGVRYGGAKEDFTALLAGLDSGLDTEDEVEADEAEIEVAPEPPAKTDTKSMREKMAASVKGGKGKSAAINLL